MTELDQRRITERIRDAFAILCVRTSGRSEAETKLRLGFEALLRHLGTSPLHEVAKTRMPTKPSTAASPADLRNIIHALDGCLAILERYDAVLSTSQRRIQFLARATRRFAEDVLSTPSNTAPTRTSQLPVPTDAIAVSTREM